MLPYLEHANLTVRNLDEALRFITTALPEFSVRYRGVSQGTEWAHVGTADFYVAFSEAIKEKSSVRYDEIGINHVGFVVQDADAVARALKAAGFREGIQVDPHPYRKRVYFHDADDNEWEFVEYLTDDPALRNDYTA